MSPNQISVMVSLSSLDSEKKAMEVSRKLVKERVAACVNILPNVLSIYHWKGKIEESKEWILMIKTSPDRYSDLERVLNKIHPYDVPEFISFLSSKQSKAFGEWVGTETLKKS